MKSGTVALSAASIAGRAVVALMLTASSVLSKDVIETGTAPTTQKRVALVIGNAAYEQGALRNPVNDARAIADRLQRFGFVVIKRENLRTREIGGALREFRARLSPGDVALFFYAGHGLQIKGINYLPAVDAHIDAEEDVYTQALDFAKVLELMEEAKTSVNLAFLDACRDNPYVRNFRSTYRGLAKVNAPSGTLISFGTRPGSVAADGVGKNGLYTEYLIKHMEEIGVPIEQMLKRVGAGVKLASKGKQEPWSEGLIEGDFYFRPEGQLAGYSPTVSQSESASTELAFWESVRTSANSADLVAYLDRYPNGPFAQLARNRIEALQRASASSSASPAAQSSGSSAAIQNLNGTLKKIRETGAITIGHRDASIPFSYYDVRNQPIGYAMDLCHLIVAEAKTALGMPAIDVRYQLVTSANRFALVASGVADIECGSSTNTFDRQGLVAFTITHWITESRFASKANLNLRTFDDLRGKTVVSTAGTNNLRQLMAVNDQRNLGMNIVSANGHPDAFRMVMNGEAAAFVMDDILLYSLIAQTRNPVEWAVSSEGLSIEPYAIVLRRDDPQFKSFIDSVLTKNYKNGQIVQIYKKWFLEPVPPRGLNLNIPISARLSRVFTNPTDSPDQRSYQ